MTRNERVEKAWQWFLALLREPAPDRSRVPVPVIKALAELRADVEELREEVERLKGLDATILAVRQALRTPSFVPVGAHVQALVQATFLRETQRQAAAPAAGPDEELVCYFEPIPQNLGWYCPDSPDKRCHYFSERNEDGERVVNLAKDSVYVMDVDAEYDGRDENEDECLFCGEPKERK